MEAGRAAHARRSSSKPPLRGPTRRHQEPLCLQVGAPALLVGQSGPLALRDLIHLFSLALDGHPCPGGGHDEASGRCGPTGERFPAGVGTAALPLAQEPRTHPHTGRATASRARWATAGTLGPDCRCAHLERLARSCAPSGAAQPAGCAARAPLSWMASAGSSLQPRRPSLPRGAGRSGKPGGTSRCLGSAPGRGRMACVTPTPLGGPVVCPGPQC